LVSAQVHEKLLDYKSALEDYKQYTNIALSVDKNKLINRINALEQQLNNVQIQKNLKVIEQENRVNAILIAQNKRDKQIRDWVLGTIIVLVCLILILYYRLYKKNKNNYQLSITDGLCHCYNRTYLFKEYAVKLYDKPQTHFLFLLDIDNFKHFNDNYGHEAGDLVLKTVTKNIMSCLNDEVLIRLGGEEFVIIGQNINEKDLLAEKIRKSIAKLNINITSKEIVQVTCSIGISTKVIANKSDLSCLISEADSAMYHAKSEGKDRIYNFSDMTGAVHIISSKIR
jgi:diguanylate cyclase (GGDEF)-like protein